MKMKKYSFILGLALAIFFVSHTTVSAQGQAVWEALAGPLNLSGIAGDPSAGIAALAGGLINWAVALAGIALTVYLIYGGFLYLTSSGDPQRIEKAQGALKNALIGFMIVIFVFALSSLLQFLFGVNEAPAPGGGTGG